MKTAMIFGSNGQDGSYLAELLLKKGYGVTGICRRASVDTTIRLTDALQYNDFHLREGDVTDYHSVSHLLETNIEVDEVYNLAAQSHVQTSFEQPHYTTETDYIGVLNILEAIRKHAPTAKFYQASTSEMFGNNCTTMSQDGSTVVKFQDEGTIFAPTSPYAIAKVAAHHLVKMYRKAYNIFACAGILFNHESERRGDQFVTRKITRYVGWLAHNLERMQDPLRSLPLGNHEKLHLGALDSKRDWGHAEDYVKAMWMMMQQEKPSDYVIATGTCHTVAEFCAEAFKVIGIEHWQNYVFINEKFLRPSDVQFLCGSPFRAGRKLHWHPEVTFAQLVQRMVKSDIEKMQGKQCPTLL